MARRTFHDRRDAGERLAAVLAPLQRSDIVVLGLPRGGVPVAAAVATAFGAPLDVLVARKLGVPWQPELALGAVAEDGARVIDDRLVTRLGISPATLLEVERAELAELARRATVYRQGAPPLPVEGRTAFLVDDGVATGATAIAACRSVRRRGALRVVVAVPVAPEGWGQTFREEADDTVAVITPPDLVAVGRWYDRFEQLDDAQVLAALHAATGPSAPSS